MSKPGGSATDSLRCVVSLSFDVQQVKCIKCGFDFIVFSTYDGYNSVVNLFPGMIPKNKRGGM